VDIALRNLFARLHECRMLPPDVADNTPRQAIFDVSQYQT
jgi:hypothetical protein